MVKTFLISDLHLNHRNIIRFCNRPFRSVGEMNRVLVDNWNKTVGKDDVVYFLGDLCCKNHSYWLNRLNGNIVFIRGNHDRFFNTILYEKLRYDDKEMLLIHDPRFVDGFGGRVIHGHKHNNNTTNFPLINFKNKTVNVSCELIDYTPISFDRIINLIS